jgi:hypothetical protein
MDRSLSCHSNTPASPGPLALLAKVSNAIGRTPARTARTGRSPATPPAARPVCTSRNAEGAVIKRSISSRSMLWPAEPVLNAKSRVSVVRAECPWALCLGRASRQNAWTSIRSPTGRDSRSNGGQSSKIPPAAQAQPVGRAIPSPTPKTSLIGVRRIPERTAPPADPDPIGRPRARGLDLPRDAIASSSPTHSARCIPTAGPARSSRGLSPGCSRRAPPATRRRGTSPGPPPDRPGSAA